MTVKIMKLNRIVRFVMIIPLALTANVPSQEALDHANTLIQEQMYLDKQKDNFKNKLQQDAEQKKIYEVEPIVVEADRNEIECVQIEVINIRGSTLLGSFDFVELPIVVIDSTSE